MDYHLRQGTAGQARIIGPFSADGQTPATGLTIENTDIKLMVNGGAAANKSVGGATHRANGEYAITFDDTDTATVGELAVNVTVAGSLPVRAKFTVLTAAVYDALYAATAAAKVDLVDGPNPTAVTAIKNGLATTAGLANVQLASTQPNYAPAKQGDQMDLVDAVNSNARDAIATTVESHLLDDGDSQMLINAIVGAIGNTNIDQAVLVAAIRSDMERPGGNLATLLSRLTADRATYLDKLNVTGVLAHTGNAATFQADVSGLSTYDGSDTAGVTALLDRLTADRATYLDKLNVAGVLANTDNADTFKADVAGLSTFNPATDEIESGVTYEKAWQGEAAVLLGAISTAGEAAEIYAAVGNPGTTRVTVGATADGDRTTVVIA